MKTCDICQLDSSTIQTHHIVSKKYGGTNDRYNLINICPLCHNLVHQNQIIVESKILSTKGYIVIWHKKEDKKILETEDPKTHVYSRKE